MKKYPMPIVSAQQASTEKLPPHPFCLVHRVGKTTNITGKKLLSLQPIVRTRRSYNRIWLIKRQKYFQGLATYGHEVLMSLQTRANFFGIHWWYSFVNDIGLIGEWQFILRENVCNIYRLPIWCQLLRMLTFQLPYQSVFLFLGLTWTVLGWFNSKMMT